MASGINSYELSNHAKKIIEINIRHMKTALDSFQFNIQDRVTPITEGALNTVNNHLHNIREVLENERKIDYMYQTYVQEEEEC